VDNVSLAGSAASDRIGHALFSTNLILVQVAFSDRHLNFNAVGMMPTEIGFRDGLLEFVHGTENQYEE
jgi:hypothetical protein